MVHIANKICFYIRICFKPVVVSNSQNFVFNASILPFHRFAKNSAVLFYYIVFSKDYLAFRSCIDKGIRVNNTAFAKNYFSFNFSLGADCERKHLLGLIIFLFFFGNFGHVNCFIKY